MLQQKNLNMEKNKLKVDTIYHFKNGFEGLKICVLKSNRNNPIRNKKMMEGCMSVEMQSPGIFADASLAMKAGYELIDVEDGHTVMEAEVNDYLVIVDGNTRFHAWELAKKDGNQFEYLFQYKKYDDSKAFRNAYQKVNVCNTPTSTADFARDLEAISNNPVIVSYRSKTNEGLAPKASGYATIGREITKKDMVELQEGITPALFNDKANQDIFENVYDKLIPIRKGSPSTFKGTEIWSWIANKINGAEDKLIMSEAIIKMFLTMSIPTFLSIQKAKKDGNRSKEAVVKDYLDKALQSMN